MADKKIFDIPLTNSNPFEVAITKGMEQAASMVGFPITSWETQLSPDQWTQGINKAVEEKYNLIDLVGRPAARIYRAADPGGAQEGRQGHGHPRL